MHAAQPQIGFFVSVNINLGSLYAFFIDKSVNSSLINKSVASHEGYLIQIELDKQRFEVMSFCILYVSRDL